LPGIKRLTDKSGGVGAIYAGGGSDNPFDFGKGLAVAVQDWRKFDRTGRQQRSRGMKQDLTPYNEKDIKDALRKGAKLVSYEEKIPE
jgi:hypothetical protein